MIIDKELLSLNDIAKLCQTSSSNISNWRTRDSEHFPLPYVETSAGPIWKGKDIEKYLQEKKGFDVIATGNPNTKRIAVIGRARGGKSFFISRFVEDRIGFQELYCGNSSDKTVCPIYVKISETTSSELFYTFHTDFNTIHYQEKSKDLDNLRTQINDLIDLRFSQNDKENMAKIEDVVRKIRTFEATCTSKKISNTYISTIQKPSDFCKNLLRECKLGSIEIIDTPGVSGKIEISPIAKSDIYIFLIKPDNVDESQTLKKTVNQIKSEVATSKVAFLYKVEGIFGSEKAYNNAKVQTQKNMSAYTDLFSDLKGNIISTELDILDPASHCIVFPTMAQEEVILPEKLFLNEIKLKLIEAFNPESTEEDSKFKELFHEDKAKNFALSIMQNIPLHKFSNMQKEYTTNDIRSEKHNRVMTKDNYRLRNDLDIAYKNESNLLYEYFSSFIAQNYPEEWQQKIIKFIYKKIINSIKNDRGLGVGSHPFEEHPARTMLVEESLFADDILKNIQGKNDLQKNTPYRNALKNNNISSSTWNWVGCSTDPEAIIKLELIQKFLLNAKVSNRQEMVLFRYIGGLRKIAQYNILTLIGFDKKTVMDELKKLPF